MLPHEGCKCLKKIIQRHKFGKSWKHIVNINTHKESMSFNKKTGNIINMSSLSLSLKSAWNKAMNSLQNQCPMLQKGYPNTEL